MSYPATPKQLGFIEQLLKERICKDSDFPNRVKARIDAGTLSKHLASEAISYLLKQEKDPNVPAQYPRTQGRAPYRSTDAMRARVAKYANGPQQSGTNVATASNPLPEIKVKPGVFERPDGKIYVVKPNQQGTKLYAKRMIPISAERLNLLGNEVKFEFEYDRGAILSLTEDMRLPEDRVQELCLRYGRCIMCNRALKAAKSVKRMIGPVCYERVQGIS